MAQEVHPVHAGKLQVQDEEVEALTLQKGEGGVTAGRATHLVPARLEDAAQHGAKPFVVLNQQDSARHLAPPRGAALGALRYLLTASLCDARSFEKWWLPSPRATK